MAGSRTVELKARRPSKPDHFHVPPHDAAGVAGSERFHGRFLGGEAAGKVRGRVASFRTIRDLSVGEDPPEKAFTVAFEDLREPRNVREIHTESNDRHDRATA